MGVLLLWGSCSSRVKSVEEMEEALLTDPPGDEEILTQLSTENLSPDSPMTPTSALLTARAEKAALGEGEGGFSWTGVCLQRLRPPTRGVCRYGPHHRCP